ncbi:MAG TPA: hypothetical protein VNS58_01080 [Puia sp.]|nr:hypothetical protein [Puia sp.]
MKLHSLRLVVLAFACIILGSAFTKIHPPTKLADPTAYWWYLATNDSYYSWENTTDAETDMSNTFGYTVDTVPGGVLLAKGYINNNYPHNVLPSVLLYGH